MNPLRYPEPFEHLIELLKGFPGVGRRSAERMALSLLNWSPDRVVALGDSLCRFHTDITPCPECGNLSEGGAICKICSAHGRDPSTICVVEEASQIISIERSGRYRGLYHVLGGKISPLTGKHPEHLAIESLVVRSRKNGVKEVILALSQDVEGQATCAYVAESLGKIGITITRPALGLPAGSDIAFADAATITAALLGRTRI
jgi:recombination protein RecR